MPSVVLVVLRIGLLLFMIIVFITIAMRIVVILMVGSRHLFILFVSVVPRILLRIVIVVLMLILRLVVRLFFLSVEVLMILALVLWGSASIPIAATHILFTATPSIALSTALERCNVSILLVSMLLVMATLMIKLRRVIDLLSWSLFLFWNGVLGLLKLVCRVLHLQRLLCDELVIGQIVL